MSLIRAAVASVLAAVALLVCAAPALATAPTFPALTGRVVDDAHVLSAQTQADMTAKLAALEQKTGDQLVVVTVPSLQGYPIEDFGYQLGRAWGIGAKGKNNGAIFLIAPAEHRVRIEVGYGLEPVLTDALSSVILQQTVLPKFRAGDVEGGVVAGTDAIIQQLGLDPASAQANVAQAAQTAQQPAEPPLRGGGLIILLILFFILPLLLRGRGSGLLFAAPFLFMGGGRSDDEGGGFGGGGGGFSGGGGSFGGGGSSGSW